MHWEEKSQLGELPVMLLGWISSPPSRNCHLTHTLGKGCNSTCEPLALDLLHLLNPLIPLNLLIHPSSIVLVAQLLTNCHDLHLSPVYKSVGSAESPNVVNINVLESGEDT